jgi:acetoin utilization deacetylase AcuC-like enzyme
MKLFASDHHPVPLPRRHPFPDGKYARLRERLNASELAGAIEVGPAPAASRADLELAHDPAYVRRVLEGGLEAAEVRRLGLPWSPELVTRARHAVGGTIAACRAAIGDGIAVNLGGGTHHAGFSSAAGFCIFNDSVIAARVLLAEARVRRVVVLDCDVHQGDGTADLVASEPTIFSFSIHGADNFPFRKKTSDLDVALATGTGDREYLEALEPALREAFDRARADLAIYLAGADPFHGDRYGRLALTKSGLEARDRMVIAASRDRGVPLAVTLAGGYARELEDVVDINLKTIRCALDRFRSDSNS